jgi:hypothetical protein
VARTSATQRLEALARPLRPERAPYFMRMKDRPVTLRRVFPAEGWYWRPRGHPVAVFLGRNYDEARDELIEQLHRAETEAEAPA